tara:strand:+ start:77475 stop:78140 length:666 start_codon:yes stop_codon:yes gene_type:complete
MNVLAIGAHPDDVEIGCGGTLAKYVKEGHSVSALVVTSGNAGSNSMGKSELAEIRQNEASSAAQVIGLSSIEFLELEDGLTAFTKNDKIEVINVIRKLKPQIIFTHSSSDHFPDHKLVYELSMGAIRIAAGPWYQEAVGDPHKVEAIYGYEVWHPLNDWQLSVDVTPFFETKVRALQCHKSQLQDMDYVKAVRGLASYRAAMQGAGEYAEVFEVLRTPALA